MNAESDVMRILERLDKLLKEVKEVARCYHEAAIKFIMEERE